MSRLGDILKEKARQINRDKVRREAAQAWIEWAFGTPKVVSFRTPDEAHHLVFTKANVELREGLPPSFQVHYQGDEETMLKILGGQATAASVWKSGKFHVWGHLSDALRFEKLL